MFRCGAGDWCGCVLGKFLYGFINIADHAYFCLSYVAEVDVYAKVSVLITAIDRHHAVDRIEVCNHRCYLLRVIDPLVCNKIAIWIDDKSKGLEFLP